MHEKYRQAGVDPERAGDLIRSLMSGTTSQSPLPAHFFCQLVPLPDWMLTKPGTYLALGTDGVGTKLMLGIQTGQLDGLGQDLVGMVYNDLITCGGEPFAFLDYYATGQLQESDYRRVIQSIRQACEVCNMPLLGGETAEMPGLYGAGDFDLAGFGVAAVDQRDLLQPTHTAPGDLLIGFPSSGFHSNGYSLIRKVIEDAAIDLGDSLHINGKSRSVADWLMTPTRLYVDVIEAIRAHDIEVLSLAHITGGGYFENLPRALADTCSARLKSDWPASPVTELFQWFATRADMDWPEMMATFNCGYGLVAACRPSAGDAILAQFPDAAVLGTVEPRGEVAVRLDGT